MSELIDGANGDAAGAVPATGSPAQDGPGTPVDDAVVRRTKDGWRVGDADLPDLTSAMVLADLISAELAAPEPATADASDSAGSAASQAHAAAGLAEDRSGTAGQPKAKTKARAGKAKEPASEARRLRATIGQLEHALTARIRVEQAIGVLAERHRIQPRQAFEQLRNAARSRGRRVIDIASDVVASATNPLLQLPDELSRPRSAGRRGRHTHGPAGVLGSE
jgi:hypothetical protein